MGRHGLPEDATEEKMPHLAASVLSDAKEHNIEIAFPHNNADFLVSDEKDLEGSTRPQELTFKQIIVLFSLAFLFVSAAAPFFLILSSLSMSALLSSHSSLHRS